MPDIHELARMLKELDDQLVNCMRCGMCQAVCPVFAQTGNEADVTRGKLALLDALASEMVKDPDSVNDKLNKCLLCGTCQANCPSGVSVMEIFLKGRAILTGYLGLPPIKKAIFKGMLQNPKLFNLLTDMGSKFQGLFTKSANEMLGSSCTRFDFAGLGGRHFKGLAGTPLHKTIPSLDTPAGASGKRVAIFVGCAIDKIFPTVGEAMIKVLKHHGVGIYMPAGQSCCGIPVLSSGDVATFSTLVRQNLKLFEKGEFDYIVTACASCTSTLHELWPDMISDDSLKPRLKKLAEKTMDINQFLVDVIGVQPLEAAARSKKVTYHDPCHLRNSLKITAQPRTMIKASGNAFVEMNNAASCCGCGGSFNLVHYDVSKKIGAEKAANIINSGADIASTACPACMLQITDMLSQANARMEVKHPIELYADTLA